MPKHGEIMSNGQRKMNDRKKVNAQRMSRKKKKISSIVNRKVATKSSDKFPERKALMKWKDLPKKVPQ